MGEGNFRFQISNLRFQISDFRLGRASERMISYIGFSLPPFHAFMFGELFFGFRQTLFDALDSRLISRDHFMQIQDHARYAGPGGEFGGVDIFGRRGVADGQQLFGGGFISLILQQMFFIQTA